MRVIVYEDNVVYVGGLYYLLKGTTDENREATVTSIYGGKNTSLDAKNVAQYYSGTINIPETIIYDGNKYTVRKVEATLSTARTSCRVSTSLVR